MSMRPTGLSWRRAATALGVVVLASALGVGLGIGLRTMLSAVSPMLGELAEVFAAVLGFGLGWWWYVSAGNRWAAETGESRWLR